ncbi:MAG: thioredoxin family protein [Ekhidna sp.]|nr:thioredoxin family protein [Ekhidna sp.]
MNKQKFLPFIAIAIAFLFVGQPQGMAQMKFEKGSWEKVLKKARKQGKYIFVDCYTTWCGPCKLMDKKVFPDQKVGEFYNENFINFKIDMESPEGLAFGQYFFASVYPTFYYLDSQGNTVLKTAGYNAAEKFIATGEQALKETVKQLYGKVDVAQERKKEKTLQKNKYMAYINYVGYKIEPKEWEETLADAKANNKNIIAIIGDSNWPIPEQFSNADTRIFLQENFEIVAVSFSQSYLFDENGDYVEDENGKLLQTEWMTRYSAPVYPGVNFINPNGEILIGGGLAEALDLGKGVLDNKFKPKMGFFKSVATTNWGFQENENFEEKLAEAAKQNKPLMIMWHRKNDNLLPVYEDQEVIDAMKGRFVVMTLNGREREVEAYKKYGSQTGGINGTLSVVSPDGMLIGTYRVGPLATKDTVKSILENAR